MKKYDIYEDENGKEFLEIDLTKSKKTLVSKNDLELVLGKKWHYTSTGYAARRKNGKIELMHRIITGALKGQVVDHKNGDRLDNRRENLRLVTYTENGQNRGIQPQNTSGYKGVSFNKEKQKWHAYINKNKKRKFLGYHDSKELAAMEYNRASLQLHGEFGYINPCLKVKKVHADAKIPLYSHRFDSGFDLVAAEDVIIEPGETKLVKTGLAFEIPKGYEIQVRPRSGITLKTKLRVQLGTIDSNYRGEVGVIVDNISINGHEFDYRVRTIEGEEVEVEPSYDFNSYFIRKGDRIAQGVIALVIRAKFEEADELSESERGNSGFGSTGIKTDETH